MTEDYDIVVVINGSSPGAYIYRGEAGRRRDGLVSFGHF